VPPRLPRPAAVVRLEAVEVDEAYNDGPVVPGFIVVHVTMGLRGDFAGTGIAKHPSKEK
jgi:hypothetical protein